MFRAFVWIMNYILRINEFEFDIAIDNATPEVTRDGHKKVFLVQ